ncbi:MAG: GntR family transcriptional regulator [Pseudomonadales bacterium]
MTDWGENEPIYIQLAQRVLSQIMQGALAEGEPIPSVRQVAGQERINPLTVSRGYQLLVDEGLLEKRRGLGMYVCDGARDKALARERDRFLNNEWPRIRDRIKVLGLSLDQLPQGRSS